MEEKNKTKEKDINEVKENEDEKTDEDEDPNEEGTEVNHKEKKMEEKNKTKEKDINEVKENEDEKTDEETEVFFKNPVDKENDDDEKKCKNKRHTPSIMPFAHLVAPRGGEM